MSILLSVLVLLSSSSYSISTHYCGDHLVGSTINGQNDGCGMENDTKTNSVVSNCSSSTSIHRKACCKDDFSFNEGLDFPSHTSVSYVPALVYFTDNNYPIHLETCLHIPNEYQVTFDQIRSLRTRKYLSLIQVYVI